MTWNSLHKELIHVGADLILGTDAADSPHLEVEDLSFPAICFFEWDTVEYKHPLYGTPQCPDPFIEQEELILREAYLAEGMAQPHAYARYDIGYRQRRMIFTNDFAYAPVFPLHEKLSEDTLQTLGESLKNRSL